MWTLAAAAAALTGWGAVEWVEAAEYEAAARRHREAMYVQVMTDTKIIDPSADPAALLKVGWGMCGDLTAGVDPGVSIDSWTQDSDGVDGLSADGHLADVDAVGDALIDAVLRNSFPLAATAAATQELCPEHEPRFLGWLRAS